MKILKLLIFLIVSISYSQDTIYFDKKYKKTENISEGKYFQLLDKSINPDLTIERGFLMDGILKFEKFYKDYESDKKDLVEKKFYYPNGKLHINSHFKNDKFHGDFLSYWENGKLKRQDQYKNGKFKDGQCWNQNGKLIEFYKFESHPEFPGGTGALGSYIQSNVNPAIISSNNKGKKAVIRFAIDIDGKIKDIEVIKSEDPNLTIEAIRLVKEMPNWKPATQDGNKVKVTRTIPITF